MRFMQLGGLVHQTTEQVASADPGRLILAGARQSEAESGGCSPNARCDRSALSWAA